MGEKETQVAQSETTSCNIDDIHFQIGILLAQFDTAAVVRVDNGFNDWRYFSGNKVLVCQPYKICLTPGKYIIAWW